MEAVKQDMIYTTDYIENLPEGERAELIDGYIYNMGTPDWIIEIVSPSSVRMDYFIKLFKYPTAGVREYWIVDPIKKTITVHNFEKETTVMYDFIDKIKVGIYEELYIDFSHIEI